MNTLHKTFVIGYFLVLTNSGFGATLPTLHAIGEHHYAMLEVPASVHPIEVRITNAQQQVFLHLTLNAAQGAYEKLNFSRMPTGHYFLEVHFGDQSFYKSVFVQQDRIRMLDTNSGFRTTPYAQL